MPSTTFHADAILSDMDGTFTDSIAAVEAAWGAVALDLGLNPESVIAATHGKRAVDNLAHFRPEIRPHEMDAAVTAFEQSILDFADSFQKREALRRPFPVLSQASLTSANSSRADSFSTPSPNDPSPAGTRCPSFASRLSSTLSSTLPKDSDVPVFDESPEEKHTANESYEKRAEADVEAAWETEAEIVDRSIRILPGVKDMIACIPDGRYAVATSGAKTYAYGAMTRVGITPPPVTITADDKRLKAGKPAPDPFLLAAVCLGFDARRCVVFKDSPSGIRAGVASGAMVIAVCTSHERSKIEGCGAHFIVEDMRKVRCRKEGEGKELRLVFTIEH
ncbi:HAD-like protein [Phellopilus nigrolimitatus]|nr:HAD-like protein [Phellopilus nigrolimitatus]